MAQQDQVEETGWPHQDHFFSNMLHIISEDLLPTHISHYFSKFLLSKFQSKTSPG